MIKSIAIDDPNIFSICKNSLDKGGVILYPTDTLYGFGVDARNANAIKKVPVNRGTAPKAPEEPT